MEREQVMSLPGNDNPVLCADGKLGMLVLYPSKPGDRCGVQVPGEERHRWIDAADLTASEGGALRQAGAPKLPSMPRPIIDTHYLEQTLLASDWVRRGGMQMAG